MESVDTIIHAGWVIPIEPMGTVLEAHAIAIKDGNIVGIVPSETVSASFTASRNINKPQHIIMPGLINAHSHAAMSLFRGYADDLPLQDWLQQHIWPAEQKHVDESFVRDGTELAIAEMLRSGITCFNDMYFFPNITAEVALSCGIRSLVSLLVIDFPTQWASTTDEYFYKAEQVYDEYKNHPLLNMTVGPHAPYSISDETFARVVRLAQQYQLPIHIHTQETEQEIRDAIDQYGVRPLKRLHNLGVTSEHLINVHMTQVNEEDIEILRSTQSHVVHCPQSNLKLNDGLCPTQQLLDNEVNVAIGTDGAASNNATNMLQEVKTASLIGKIAANSPTAINAETALRMATINAAKALNIDDVTGSLVVGKSADLIAVDISWLESQPVYNPISQMVYAVDRSQITDVWVAGNALMEDRTLITLNQEDIKEKAKKWAQKIQN